MRKWTGTTLWAILLWLLAAPIMAGMAMALFVLPAKIAAWHAGGVRELPWTWQIAVDASDFSMHRGALILVPLLIAAIVVTRAAARRAAA